MPLLLPRRRQGQLVHRDDGPLSRAVDQRLLMGAVIEQEPLRVVPPHEMPQQQGQHTVFRLDLPHKHSVVVGKTGKSGEQMGLVIQVPHRSVDDMHPLVPQIPQHRRPLFITVPHQAVDVQLFFRQAGQKSPVNQFLRLTAHLRPDGAVHPLRLVPLRVDAPGLPESIAVILRPTETHRFLLVGVAVKHAGQEPLEGSVVLVTDLIHAPASPSNSESCSGMAAMSRGLSNAARWPST